MARAFADPYSLPLDTIDVPKAALFEIHTPWGHFERLRAEDLPSEIIALRL